MQTSEPIRKTKVGRVVSDKMDKTVIVQVEMVRRHPIYRRAVRRMTKFQAHDENGTAHTGDTVKIIETRPLSKEKRWRVVEILKKGEQLD